MQAIPPLAPAVIVNCAAMTAVDRCESEQEAAYRVNAAGPHNLALAARRCGAALLHVSTDYVFDGSKGGPYDELDPPNPLSVYGRSKLGGEERVREILPEHFVVRTGYVFGSGRDHLTRSLDRLRRGEEAGGITDRIGSPTYVVHLAERLLPLIRTGRFGTYHLAGSEAAPWFDVLRRARDIAGLAGSITPQSAVDLGLPAPRPANSARSGRAPVTAARKVLMVSAYPPRRCGVGSYAKASVERMREEGDHVVVLSPPDGEGDVRVPFGRGRPFLRAARMGPGFDLVQVQYQPSLYDRPGLSPSKVLTALSLLWLVRKRKQTEIVVHEAGRPKWWRPDHFLLHRVFARARLAFHTDAERRHLEKDWRVRTRFRLIDHAGGVRIATRLAREEARDRLSIGDHEILFLCAGFLHPDKAFERAVRAFPGPPGARLVVLGSVRDGEPGNARYARSLRDLCERTPGVALIEG